MERTPPRQAAHLYERVGERSAVLRDKAGTHYLTEILVVHDDLDMPLGRLRFKTGGGAGGQRGVADIRAKIGADFHRLKIGISRPPEGWKVENWVLSRFREDERDLLEEVIRHCG